jgi:hypothetical protein
MFCYRFTDSQQINCVSWLKIAQHQVLQRNQIQLL